MEIIVDIGNTNVVIGFFKEGDWKHVSRFVTKKDEEAKVFYDIKLKEELLDLDFEIDKIVGIYLSSVVPQLTPVIEGILNSIFDHSVVIIQHNTFKKLKIAIDKPSEIGSDLVANAVAAVARYKTGCIIVDFGTALTFTVITSNYELLGVAIAPGLKTSMSALHSKTAQLPEVPLELPSSVIGKNTTHAIQSGVLWGYVGLVKEMVHRIQNEHEEKLLTIATGGLSSILYPVKEIFHDIDRTLTIDGIRIIGRQPT